MGYVSYKYMFMKKSNSGTVIQSASAAARIPAAPATLTAIPPVATGAPPVDCEVEAEAESDAIVDPEVEAEGVPEAAVDSGAEKV